MAIFPGALASFAGFVAGHTLAVDNHAAQHNSEQAEIIAAQVKLGTGSSTPVSGQVLTGTGTGTSSWSQVNLTTMVSGTLPVANGGTGQSTLTNLPLVTPIIADFTNANHNHANAGGGGQLTETGLNLTKSTADANGWVKRNYGNWQTYEQTYPVVNVSISANSGTALVSLNLPVGISDTSGVRIYGTYFGGNAGRIYGGLDNGSVTSAASVITLWLGNSTTGNLTAQNGFFYVSLITT